MVLNKRQAGVPMCFSATASFVTVGITTAAAVACLTRVRGWRELPLASLLTLVFLLYAQVFRPAFAPVAALLIEPDRTRHRLMAICAVIVSCVWRRRA